jgi:hypothetical protein
MTKMQILAALRRRGVNGNLAACRMEATTEFRQLKDDEVVRDDTLDRWMAESPVINGRIYAARQHLSESDLNEIGRLIRPAERKEK